MNAHANTSPDHNANRPVYNGISWEHRRANIWSAPSATTPMSYIVEEIEDGLWAAKQGFQDIPGRPNAEIGRYVSMTVAMTACERHDFVYWASVIRRSGGQPVFMGSPDRVADFVSNLAEHERADLMDMIAGDYTMQDGETFSTKASYFPAVKSALKQEKSGAYTATLSIEAADVPMWFLHLKPGAHIAAAVAAVNSEADDEWSERAANALKRSFALIQDGTFHAWMAAKYDNWGLIRTAASQTSEQVEEAVAETLRRLIGCPSRRDLATNRDSVAKLEKLDREFYLDMSRGYVETA